MKRNSILTWSLATIVGIFAAACSDQPEQTAPLVPDNPQFALGTSVLTGTTVINGARWTAVYPLGVGTGQLDPFLSIQNNGSEEGFNTDTSPLPLNDTRPQFTDAVQLNAIPVISEAGGVWRELILDANEANSTPDAQFSIDFFNVYVCHDANAATYGATTDFTSNANCSQVYNITGHAALRASDAGTSGSGSDLDYRILIPAASFGSAANAACSYNPNATGCGYYVVVHTKMGGEGGDWVTGSTFEEISTIKRPAVSIVKTPDAQSVNAGNAITFTIVVTNSGPGNATAVTVTDTLPAGTGINWSTTTTGCSIAGAAPSQVLNCTFATLAEAAANTITVTSPTTAGSCGTYNNTASFNSTNAGFGTDNGQITVTNCTGKITIVKNTIGGDTTFGFTAGGSPLVDFDITTSGGTGQNGPTTVPAATYSVSEKALSPSWEFVSVVCTGNGAGGTTSSTSLQTATLVVGLGADVTCTFTNRKKGTIRIIKNTVGGDSAFSFTHDITGASPASPFSISTAASTGNQQFNFVSAGTYHVSESGPSGSWEFVSLSCTSGGAVAGQQATITLPAGGLVTCTFTNRKKAILRIAKVTNPDGSQVDFTFSPTGGWNSSVDFTRRDNQAAFASALLTPGTYGATETVPAGWSLVSRTCVNTGGGAHGLTQTTNGVSVSLAAGEDVTCTFTNTELATLIVTKSTNSASMFDFTRYGCTSAGVGCGQALPNAIATSFQLGNLGSSTTGKLLPPGNYRVCEVGIPVASYAVSATLTDGSNANAGAASFDPALTGTGDFCVDVALTAGNVRTVAYTNMLQGGTTRTIGYWKNWSSCSQSGGKQYDKAVAPGGVGIGKTLDGNITNALVYNFGLIAPSLNCSQAVNLLAKSSIDGTKQPGDAIYSMAAQLLAARLNMAAGAGTCPAAAAANASAQSLLVALGFNGLGAYAGKGAPASKTQIANANSYAGVLDSYNNGTLGGTCPTHAI